MDRRQFDVLHSAIIRMEKRQTEMAEDVGTLIKSVDALNDKTIVINDVNERMDNLDDELKNIKDEVIA